MLILHFRLFLYEFSDKGDITMIKDTTDEYSSIEIFRGKININLFNEVIAFVMATSAEEALPIHKSLTEKHLWDSQTSENAIRKQYGFRYFGELLERFEENFDSDITDIRAIALAMLEGTIFNPERLLKAICGTPTYKSGGEYKSGYTLLSITADGCENKYIIFNQTMLESLVSKLRLMQGRESL